jgi:plasmid stabilization system protein ParE
MFPAKAINVPTSLGGCTVFSVYQYMIVYRRTTSVETVTVLHGKRDVERLLKTRI